MSGAIPKQEMGRYTCVKKVWAFKIAAVKVLDGADFGWAMLVPEDKEWHSRKVSPEYMTSQGPYSGGYYIIDDGGYESFCLARYFADTYTKIEQEKPCAG